VACPQDSKGPGRGEEDGGAREGERQGQRETYLDRARARERRERERERTVQAPRPVPCSLQVTSLGEKVLSRKLPRNLRPTIVT